MKHKFPDFLIWLIAAGISFGGVLAKLPKAHATSAYAEHVVISEVQINGTTTNDEFVELFNPTNAIVNLNGWRLAKKTAGGTLSNLVTDFGDVNIPATGYFLVAHANYDGGTTRDLTYTTAGIIANDNTVILYSDAGITTVDKIGFGAAGDYEGTAFISNPTSEKSLERKTNASGVDPTKGNNYDTNDNSQDFVLRDVADPQNSSSPIKPTTDFTLPTITGLTPTNGSLITTAQPLISAAVTDDQAGVMATITLDGEVVANTIISNTISYTPVVNLAEGNHTVIVNATDAFGNAASPLSATFIIDTLAPTATFTINHGALLTGERDVTLYINADDEAVGMWLSEQTDLVDVKTVLPNGEPITATRAFHLSADDGQKVIYFQTVDAAGNLSPIISQTIELSSKINQSVVSKNIAPGDQVINTLPGIDVFLTATGATTLTVASYGDNPTTTSAPEGLIFVNGQYYDFRITDNNAITWPITIHIKYTTAQLTAAGITRPEQIFGLYFYDQISQTWKEYTNTDGQTGIVSGATGDGYDGYIYARVNHLTPIFMIGDITAPASPRQLSLTLNDNGEAQLSWPADSGATAYIVRYKANDETGYKEVTITNNSTKITGLRRGVDYEFQIFARDRAQNLSTAAVVSGKIAATPVEVIEEKPLPAVSKPAPFTIIREVAIPKAQAAEPKKEEGGIPVVEKTEPKPEEEPSGRNWTRALLSLVIIIVAIAGGLISWYGYRWWVQEEEEEVTKEKPEEKLVAKPQPRRQSSSTAKTSRSKTKRW